MGKMGCVYDAVSLHTTTVDSSFLCSVGVNSCCCFTLSAASLQKHFPISSLCIQFCSFIPHPSPFPSALLPPSIFPFLLPAFHLPASSWRILQSPLSNAVKALNNTGIAPLPSRQRWRRTFSWDRIWHHDDQPLGETHWLFYFSDRSARALMWSKCMTVHLWTSAHVPRSQTGLIRRGRCWMQQRNQGPASPAVL